MVTREEWFNKSLYRDAYKKMGPASPTHLLTISLSMPIKNEQRADAFNAGTAAAREKLDHEIIIRIDRQVYGSNFAKHPVDKRFPFLSILETRDKNARVTPCHYHMVLDMHCYEQRFTDKWPRIVSSLDKLILSRGLDPSVVIKPCDAEALDYILKNAVFDADSIYTRTLMSKGI